MSSWMSCLYCSLWSAQLWSRLLSGCCPNNGGGAVNVFQSNLKGMFVDDCSRYLASRFGKFRGKGVGEIWLIDGVDGSDNVSGSDDDVVVSVEISIGSFIKFGSTYVNECVFNMVVVMFGWGGGGYRDCHVLVQMLVLNLSNLRVYLRCYVVKEV